MTTTFTPTQFDVRSFTASSFYGWRCPCHNIVLDVQTGPGYRLYRTYMCNYFRWVAQ